MSEDVFELLFLFGGVAFEGVHVVSILTEVVEMLGEVFVLDEIRFGM